MTKIVYICESCEEGDTEELELHRRDDLRQVGDRQICINCWYEENRDGLSKEYEALPLPPEYKPV